MGTKCGQQAMKPDKLTVARGRVEGQTHPGSRQALQQEAGGSPEGGGDGQPLLGPLGYPPSWQLSIRQAS